MHISSAAAQGPFETLRLLAREQPVVVEVEGLPDTVVLSWSEFQRLTQGRNASQDASVDFSRRYQAWIAEQNHRTETEGLWNDELRVW